MTMMNVWIGHYKENPSEWFIAWGETEEEAWLTIDATDGEPDRRSMKLLTEPGLVSFRAALAKEDDLEYAACQAYGAVWLDPADGDHVTELLREPLDIDEGAAK